MEGIDGTFDAVVFIGNHARAGTPNAVLKHTMSLSLFDVILNGVRLPEAAWNAAIAGYYGVPVVFLSGDTAVCKQIQEIIGPIETVAVKDGMGPAASMIHPAKSREMIQKGVATALRNLKAYRPYKPGAPYKLEIVFTDENLARRASLIPRSGQDGRAVGGLFLRRFHGHRQVLPARPPLIGGRREEIGDTILFTNSTRGHARKFEETIRIRGNSFMSPNSYSSPTKLVNRYCVPQ